MMYSSVRETDNFNYNYTTNNTSTYIDFIICKIFTHQFLHLSTRQPINRDSVKPILQIVSKEYKGLSIH